MVMFLLPEFRSIGVGDDILSFRERWDFLEGFLVFRKFLKFWTCVICRVRVCKGGKFFEGELGGGNVERFPVFKGFNTCFSYKISQWS